MFQKLLRCFRKWYVINQADRIQIPEFRPDRTCRWRITFSGRVQNVGFRMEAARIACRLDLTGFCENLPDGDVLGEFQGPQNKIAYLISFMESLNRIVIENKIMEEIPLLPDDSGFDCR